MTESALDDVIHECLTTDATIAEPPPPIMWRLGEFGDAAFTKLSRMLSSAALLGEQAARAIRCLAYLSTEDKDRILATVRLTMQLAASEDQATRSAAAHSLVHGLGVLTQWMALAPDEEFRKQMPDVAEVRAVLRRALERGLDADEQALVKEVLEHSP